MNGVPLSIDSIVNDLIVDMANNVTWSPELLRKTFEKLIAEAVEKGSIGFAKFIGKEIDDERNESPFDESVNGDIRVYYYKGDKLGCYNPTLEKLYQEYIKSLK